MLQSIKKIKEFERALEDAHLEFRYAFISELNKKTKLEFELDDQLETSQGDTVYVFEAIVPSTQEHVYVDYTIETGIWDFDDQTEDGRYAHILQEHLDEIDKRREKGNKEKLKYEGNYY